MFGQRVTDGTGDLPVVRLVDLRETPLDVAEVLDAIADPAAGGVDVFVGNVRDHDRDHGVTGLEYSAHPTALGRLVEVTEMFEDGNDEWVGTP